MNTFIILFIVITIIVIAKIFAPIKKGDQGKGFWKFYNKKDELKKDDNELKDE